MAAFGAFDDDTAPEGSPRGQFNLVTGNLSFSRVFVAGEHQLVLSSRLNGQVSKDLLFGSEQFSIGGFSSVRGTRDSLLFGNNGVQLTNTLSIPSQVKGINITPFGGFDMGHVFKQSKYDIPGGSLIGATAGLRVSGKNLSGEASYSRIIASPSVIDRGDGVLSLSAVKQF